MLPAFLSAPGPLSRPVIMPAAPTMYCPPMVIAALTPASGLLDFYRRYTVQTLSVKRGHAEYWSGYCDAGNS